MEGGKSLVKEERDSSEKERDSHGGRGAPFFHRGHVEAAWPSGWAGGALRSLEQ